MTTPKPNVLILMADELRTLQHATPELKEWYDENMTVLKFFKEEGFVFNNHYICTNACSPSRATLYTAQYPTLHGVSQTEGIAKPPESPQVFWLDPGTVPTLGNYFRQGGYKTIWKGKWHITNTDIFKPGTYDRLTTWNSNGYPYIPNIMDYERLQVLEPFGFTGYVGPEPTTNDPHRSGGIANYPVNGRDIFYTQETIETLATYHNDKPFLLFSSLVNPHDICLYNDFNKLQTNYNFPIDETLPPIPEGGNAHDDLSTKPKCQTEYKEKYQIALAPTTNTEQMRKVYYSLCKQVNDNMQAIIDSLKRTNLYDNTIIVMVSDHGDYLGSHGLFQKWFSMYEESLHVPFCIKLPRSMKHLEQNIKQIENLTCHVDMLPTLLGLCGLNEEELLRQLRPNFVCARKLVGRDLSPLLIHKCNCENFEEPILFLNNDNPFLGENMINYTGRLYTAINQPNNIKAIILKHCGQIWKFAEYYDDPQFWSSPGVSNTFTIQINQETIGDITKETTVSETYTVPKKSEYEMYNLTEDPLEMVNLMYPENITPYILELFEYFKQILKIECEKKLLRPHMYIVPNPGGVGFPSVG